MARMDIGVQSNKATLKIHNVYKDQRHRILERDKCVMQTYTCNRKKLKPPEAQAYTNTWVKTSIVAIEEGQPPDQDPMLRVSPIIVMGLPPL